MDHDAIRHKISEYLDGSITARERIEIEAHLKTCQQCGDALQELRKTIEHIKTIEEIEPAAWMTQKIMAQVRAEAEKKNWVRRFFLPLSIKLPIQAFAVVFLAIGAFYIYRNIQPAPAPSETPMQEFAAKRSASESGPAKDNLAKAYDAAPRTKQVPQAPEYKALDMKLEYDKPTPPALTDQAGAPAPAKPEEKPMMAMAKNEAAVEKRSAAPQAAAPMMRETVSSAASHVMQKKTKKAAISQDKLSHCFSYEPRVVAITGVIRTVDFPGPPEYQSISQGDSKETYWILKADRPFCVLGKNTDDLNVTETDVSEIQLVFGAVAYDTYRSLLNKDVTVTGTLFHANTIHHHTQVLFEVQDIKLLVK